MTTMLYGRRLKKQHHYCVFSQDLLTRAWVALGEEKIIYYAGISSLNPSYSFLFFLPSPPTSLFGKNWFNFVCPLLPSLPNLCFSSISGVVVFYLPCGFWLRWILQGRRIFLPVSREPVVVLKGPLTLGTRLGKWLRCFIDSGSE